MQESHLFEYAVIRVVPRVEREEFVNVGVILYCSHQKFLDTRFILNPDRLKALCVDIDLVELNNHIESFERISRGGVAAGPIGTLSIAERFRWLTATRSTILQTSKVHPGLCDDASKTLLRLYHELVL